VPENFKRRYKWCGRIFLTGKFNQHNYIDIEVCLKLQQTLSMHFLYRIKKKESVGFTEFVKELETLPSKEKWDKIFHVALEDPLYVSFVVRSALRMRHFFDLDGESFHQYCENTKGVARIFCLAFMNTPEEAIIVPRMPSHMQKDYEDEKELILKEKFDPLRKNKALGLIIKSFRNLSNGSVLPLISMVLPPIQIIRLNKNPIPTGPFELKYESGQVAQRGEIKKNYREGHWQHFYPNGNPMGEGDYLASDKTGKWIFYYPNGQIYGEGLYEKGLKMGTWAEYDANGKKTIVEYKNGKALHSNQNDQSEGGDGGNAGEDGNEDPASGTTGD
jgi:hypothetical protein